MRETCARVLIAALLTGAITTVVGMPALVDTPREPAHSIAAPPSSVQRSVRLTARLVLRHHRSSIRLATKHTSYRAPRPAIVSHSLVVVRTHRSSPRPRRRQLAAVPAVADTAPATPPAPSPVPAPAPAETGSADDADEVVPDTSPGPAGQGRGHAYGRDKQDD